MELGLGWLRAVAQGYNHNYNTIELPNFSKEFIKLGSKIKLGLGWLRAAAQGYNYNSNSIELK